MKSLLTLLITLALAGCGTLSGSYTKRPVINADGTVVTNSFGMTVYETVKISQHAAIAQAGAQAFAHKQKAEPEPPCGGLSIDQVQGLSASGQVEYFRAVGECERSRATTKLVAAALGRPMSDGDAITRNYADIVESIENGKSRRFASGVNAVTSLGTSLVIGTAVKAGFEATRDVGIAAAENSGDTTVGNISVSSSQHSSADGNTGGMASAGEMGSATGGDGSGVASNTRSDASPVTINIGDGNGVANGENTRTFVDTRSTQQIDPSGNGSITDGSKTNGSQTADDLTGDNEANDPDGGNSIF